MMFCYSFIKKNLRSIVFKKKKKKADFKLQLVSPGGLSELFHWKLVRLADLSPVVHRSSVSSW